MGRGGCVVLYCVVCMVMGVTGPWESCREFDNRTSSARFDLQCNLGGGSDALVPPPPAPAGY